MTSMVARTGGVGAVAISTAKGPEVDAGLKAKATALALSRIKMIKLVVEARLLQAPSNGTDLLPH